MRQRDKGHEMLDFAYDPPDRNPGKPWLWILVDSLIIGLIAFVATLPGDRLPDIYDIYVAVRAFLYSFLMQVAIERGLKPRWSRKKRKKK